MPPMDFGVAHEDEPIIDFGGDKDMKHLLRSIQPKSFTGEGTDVPRALDEWITSMEDYFALAGYNELAKRVMARAKLEGGAKTWWKLSCQSRGVSEVTQSWDEIKERIRQRYHNRL